MPLRLGRGLVSAALLITAGTVVLVQSGPAGAVGTRAWTQDFGITPNVFTTAASPTLPVGAAVPVNLVIIDNDPGCTAPSFTSCDEPTGSVTITAEDAAHTVTTLGTQALSSVPEQPGRAGEAVFSLPATLAPGTYVIEASYTGDPTFSGGGVPAALSLTITQATPAVTLTQSSATTHPGKAFSVRAAVTYPSTAPLGSPLQPETPTGSITLSESGGTAPSTLPLGGDGSVTFAIAAPTSPGNLSFTADYSGDTDLIAATSATLVHHVILAVTTSPPPPSTSMAPPPTSTAPTSTAPAATSTAPPPTSAAPTSTAPAATSAAAAATNSSTGVLAETGVRAGGLVVVAVAFLVAGAGVLAAGRRTRREH